MSSLKYALFSMVAAFLFLPHAWAGTFAFHPFLATEEKYDDNIYLTRSDTRSDWITTLSPGFTTSLADPRYNVDLTYEPGFVYFLHNPQFDYTSHELNFNSSIELTSRLTASFLESYTRSNEPELEELIETDYERSFRRDTRSTFNRNILAPQLEYKFGRENLLRFYYRNTNFKSEDPEEDDYRENFFEGDLEYWFNVRNGVTVLCHFLKGNFDLDTDLLHSIDVTPRYRYRFSPHFELYGEYGYGTSDFEERRLYTLRDDGRKIQVGLEDREDYDIHRFNFGFNWSLPHNLGFEGSMGYFWREGVGNNDDQGINSLLKIVKSTRNITAELAWRSGYSSNYFANRDSGFAKFWSITSSLTYLYQEKLEFFLRGSYGYSEYKDARTTDVREALELISEDREDYIYAVRTAITYHIFRNYGVLSDLSVALEFNHIERDSNFDTDYYINNKSIARITAAF